MSAAHSNTHQSSFSSSRGKFPRSGNARSSADESSEFKALRSKYSSSLKTLREMFPDWSDADLIYALQEADGNLEITIAHIAEGFAPQWGEVKSRKDKRQAYKQQHEESSRPYEKSYVPRPASFRGGVRGGAARGSRGSYSNAAGSTRPKPAQPDSKPQSSGESNSAAGWNVEPSSSEHKDSSSGWDVSGTPAKLSTPAAKPAAAPAPAPAPVSSKPAPMSWASIAKKGAKQAEPAAAPAAPKEKAVESAPQKSETTSENAKPEKEEPKEEEEPAAAEPEPTAEETKELEPTAEETPVETTEPEIPKATEEETEETEETETTEEPTSESQPEPAQETKPETQQAQEEVTTPVSLPKRPTSNSRRLNQDAAVVMPTGAATIERIGMQFGSFNIGGVEVADTKPAATETPAAQPEAKEPAVVTAAPAAPAAAAAAAPAAAAPAPAAAAIPEASAAAHQGPLTTYLQQQQQQQQQAQPHSGAAVSQMPLPNDYGAALYGGVDAQRSMMGFYDSYGYGQFAGMNKDDSAAAAATATAAGSQPATTVAASGAANNLSQAGLFPQQMPQPFGMNPAAMPYYSPYYYSMMQPGGQFPNPAAFGNNPALAAAYGQPFMKQGMFPMYPGAAGAQQPAQQHQPSSQGQQNAGQTQQQSQKPAGAGAQGNAAYSNLNAQKAGHPYSHYGANVGGFAGYEQDPASLANSMQQQQQQFGLGGGIPGIFSSTKGSAGAKDAGAKTAQPAGTAAAEIGGTTYYNNPQQTAGYPAQLNNAYAQQGYGHHQQAYYPYAQTQQYQQPHMYQQPQQAQQPQQQQGQQQQGHPGAGKQYWEQK